MAASTKLTATDVARILNHYGASARDMVQDVSDLIVDYFDDHRDADIDVDSDASAHAGKDTEEDEISTVTALETQQQQEVSDDVPIIRVQYDYRPDSEHTAGDKDEKLNALFVKGCGCA